MSKLSKFTPAKLEEILKKELTKQGKTRVTDLKLRGFRPKDRTGGRRDNRNARPNDRNRNDRPNDRNLNDRNRRRPMNNGVREIADVGVTPLDEEKSTASEDVQQAAAVEEPAEPSPSIPDT